MIMLRTNNINESPRDIDIVMQDIWENEQKNIFIDPMPTPTLNENIIQEFKNGFKFIGKDCTSIIKIFLNNELHLKHVRLMQELTETWTWTMFDEVGTQKIFYFFILTSIVDGKVVYLLK
jgi:hypothetical protein